MLGLRHGALGTQIDLFVGSPADFYVDRELGQDHLGKPLFPAEGFSPEEHWGLSLGQADYDPEVWMQGFRGALTRLEALALVPRRITLIFAVLADYKAMLPFFQAAFPEEDR